MRKRAGAACWSCWEPDPDAGRHHAACLRRVFGRPVLPEVEVDPAALHLFGAEMAGRVSLSGAQRKLSLGWSHKSLRVSADRAAFILKPGEAAFPALPENESLTLALARDFGIRTAEAALVPLRGGVPALLVRRFDRAGRGRRIHMEDFAQLAELEPARKYEGSAESCMKLAQEFTSDPGVQKAELFRRFLFAWWVGDGDLHRKNLAVLRPERGVVKLAPAYDTVNTTILLPDEQLALPIRGKRARLDRADWLAFGDSSGLPARWVMNELDRPRDRLAAALAKVQRSLLPVDLRAAYATLLQRRAAMLA